jgi:hypothetical protein
VVSLRALCAEGAVGAKEEEAGEDAGALREDSGRLVKNPG